MHNFLRLIVESLRSLVPQAWVRHPEQFVVSMVGLSALYEIAVHTFFKDDATVGTCPQMKDNTSIWLKTPIIVIAAICLLVRSTGLLKNWIRPNPINHHNRVKIEAEIYRAAKVGDAALMARLLDQANDKIDCENSLGATPLQEAAENGREEVVRLLLARGADVKHQDTLGQTPLDHAAKGGQTEVVRLLLDGGAEIDHVGRNGNTPLFAAIQGGHTATVHELLGRGANVNHRGFNGNTPLVYAILGKNKAIITLVLAHNPDVDQPNSFGSTPLFAAAEIGNEEVFRELIRRGANQNRVDANGVTLDLLTSARQLGVPVAQLLDTLKLLGFFAAPQA